MTDWEIEIQFKSAPKEIAAVGGELGWPGREWMQAKHITVQIVERVQGKGETIFYSGEDLHS